MSECNNKISVCGTLYHGHFADEGRGVKINYGPLLESTAVLLRDTTTPLTYSGAISPSREKLVLKFMGTRNFCQHCKVWHHG